MVRKLKRGSVNSESFFAKLAFFWYNLLMEIFNEIEYEFIQKKLLELFLQNTIQEQTISFGLPSFGEIWICKIPVLVTGKNASFKTMHRPVLIVDDTHEHFIKGDKRNYYVLKITSQEDPYERIKMKNLENTGLVKTSFIRMELPIKVEKEQFLYPIGYYERKEVEKILTKIVIIYSPK